MKQPVEVVCALIQDFHRTSVFLAKRSSSSLRPDLWEFPGGKVEEGEPHEQALQRELGGKLQVESTIGKPITTVSIDFEVSARISLYDVRIWQTPRVTALDWAVKHMPLVPSCYLFYRQAALWLATDGA